MNLKLINFEDQDTEVSGLPQEVIVGTLKEVIKGKKIERALFSAPEGKVPGWNLFVEGKKPIRINLSNALGKLYADKGISLLQWVIVL